MYSDITASVNEEPIFADLLMFGAETIISELTDLASGYAEQTGVDNTISFTLFSSRWTTNDSTYDMNLTDALKNLISNYLYNFCIGRYLSEIHPSTGDKYPPLYGRTYNEHCDIIMRNIKSLAFVKRQVTESTSIHSYANLSSSTANDNDTASDGADGTEGTGTDVNNQESTT